MCVCVCPPMLLITSDMMWLYKPLISLQKLFKTAMHKYNDGSASVIKVGVAGLMVMASHRHFPAK